MDITTGIGAVGTSDVNWAVKYVGDYDIPYWPELVPRGQPRQAETTIDIIANPGNSRCSNAFKSAFSGHTIVKGQCPGPANVTNNLLRQHSKDSDYTLEKAMADAQNIIGVHSAAFFENLNVKNVLYFFDEPSISNALFDYVSWWSTLFSDIRQKFPEHSIRSGVHTCWPPDWKVLYGSDVNIISFNATHAYEAKGRGEKIVAWGVPTLDEAGKPLPLEHVLSYIRDFRPGDFVTPECGLSFKTEEECKLTLGVLQEVAEFLRH